MIYLYMHFKHFTFNINALELAAVFTEETSLAIHGSHQVQHRPCYRTACCPHSWNRATSKACPQPPSISSSKEHLHPGSAPETSFFNSHWALCSPNFKSPLSCYTNPLQWIGNCRLSEQVGSSTYTNELAAMVSLINTWKLLGADCNTLPCICSNQKHWSLFFISDQTDDILTLKHL